MSSKLLELETYHRFFQNRNITSKTKKDYRGTVNSVQMEEGKGRVCVTGGTGFIGSMIIKRLLSEGYSVNATVRSGPGNSKKDVSFLTNLPGVFQRLKIFNADLNNPESFGEAIEGCIEVFHTATPTNLEEADVEIMSKTNVNGALGVLKVSLNSKTVKRVIFTASLTDVIYSGKEVEGIDESYWSDIDFIYRTKPIIWSNSISQLLTEKAILKFGEEHGLDVVTLILPFVIGPFICSKLPDSVRLALPWLFGVFEHGVFLGFPIIHVDDVVRAHIFMLEHPNLKGRYICSLSGTVSIEEIAELIRVEYPEFQIPTLELKKFKGEKMPSLNSNKLIDAGFEYKYGTKEIFVEAIQCCKDKGYL